MATRSQGTKVDSNIHARIAAALGWSETDTKGFSLRALRDLVRPVSVKLAHEIDTLEQSGAVILPQDEPFKHCSCGIPYTYAQWRELPFVGFHADPEEMLELRNCTCLSTMTVDAVKTSLDHHDTDLVRRIVDRWRRLGLTYRQTFARFQVADPTLDVAAFDAWLEDPV